MSGAPPIPEDTVAEWRRDFDVIYGDVQELAIQRHLYREIRRELEAGEERFANLDGTVFDWLRRMYVYSAVIAVRKQTENDPRSVSMRRLLQTIRPRAALLTRARHLAQAGELPAAATERERDQHEVRLQVLDERFDQLAGAGADHVSEASVQGDIDQILAAEARLASYVQKTIAHRDRRGIGEPTTTTWDDLNGAIDLLERLVRRYNELLQADHPPGLIPTWQYDWKAALRIPWIAPADTKTTLGGQP